MGDCGIMATRRKDTYRVVPTLDDFFYNQRAFDSYKKAVARSMIKNELICTFKVPDLVYHYTKKSNVDSILENGLNSGIDGGVFVCTVFDEAREYLETNIIGAEFIKPLRGAMIPNTCELDDFVILAFKPHGSRASKWYKRFYNHNILFYHGDLDISEVEVIELGGETK